MLFNCVVLVLFALLFVVHWLDSRVVFAGVRSAIQAADEAKRLSFELHVLAADTAERVAVSNELRAPSEFEKFQELESRVNSLEHAQRSTGRYLVNAGDALRLRSIIGKASPDDSPCKSPA